MTKSRDTFGNEITVGDIVLVGKHSLDALTVYKGDFHECIVKAIEEIENGPYGDILVLDKKTIGRNLENEVLLNKNGKYSHNDLKATDESYEIQIFSLGVIKIDKLVFGTNISNLRDI